MRGKSTAGVILPLGETQCLNLNPKFKPKPKTSTKTQNLNLKAKPNA